VAATGGGPAIVAGDLNARETSPQIQLLANGWIDAHLVASSAGGEATCCFDELTKGPGEPLTKRIDYLFIVPGTGAESLRPASAQRVFDKPFPVGDGWLHASDHAGLLVEVDFTR
jgi:endonuclease/exonuclease/phosphatase family metal-dependent hydrolase